MKKNDWLLAAAAIVFSILFYQQAPGINFLLFTTLITTLMACFNPGVLRQRRWWYYAALAHLCGTMVVVVHSDLAVFATLLTLLAVAAKTFDARSSLLVGCAFSVYSLLSAPVYLVHDLLKRRRQRVAEKRNNWGIYTGVLLALLISLLFLALYQRANPLFKNFTQQLDLNWISFGWCFFTLWGFFVIYGLVFYRDFTVVRHWDQQALGAIAPNKEEQGSGAVHQRVLVGTLFGLLNAMLLVINLLDFDNLFISKQLPAHLSLSDFVHEAVTGLIVSILFAVALIVWYFRGQLNFEKSSRVLKLLAYAWIVQSALMVVSAMMRNTWYIQEYQLTHLRIGVYCFLALSLIGLALTYGKLYLNQSAWKLLSLNLEAWLLLLALGSVVNWDKCITVYNIGHATTYDELDTHYLSELSSAGLPELSREMYLHANDSSIYTANYRSLSKALYNFLSDSKPGWQGFNLRRPQVQADLDALGASGTLQFLNLSGHRQVVLAHLQPTFTKIRALTLFNLPHDAWRFNYFRSLQLLEFNHLAGEDLRKLSAAAALTHLRINNRSGNEFNYEEFEQFQNLVSLHLPAVSNEGLLVLDRHPSLEVLSVQELGKDQEVFIQKAGLHIKVN